MTSAVRQLMDEISWEGNARKYRSGGLGKENVLTTEVFQALDFLPRRHFLGSVLDIVEGHSPREVRLAATVEQMTVSVLPGDLAADEFGVQVQPDVLLTWTRTSSSWKGNTTFLLPGRAAGPGGAGDPRSPQWTVWSRAPCPRCTPTRPGQGPGPSRH